MVNFFIPKKINVGFQKRNDTYTKKLAYVIYFDEKGKLRKENSWNSWRNQDIENEIYENEPTSGFVLNKKAGGYSTGWNHRQTYVRVYDPRGFEFEITVPNLLYILENSTSTKGKGLEGEFIYGWDGKDLVLIPTDAPDYQELERLNNLRHSNTRIGAKNLKTGATYRTKKNEEWVYIGKFDIYDWNGNKEKKQSFWFYNRECDYLETIKSVSQKFVEVISEDCAEDYAEIFEKMERNYHYSPIDNSKDEYIPFTKEEIDEKFNDWHWGYVYLEGKGNIQIKKRRDSSEYYYEYKNPEYRHNDYFYNRQNSTPYYLEEKFKDTDELIEKLQPMRLRKYLANGKIYSEGY